MNSPLIDLIQEFLERSSPRHAPGYEFELYV